MRIRLSVLSTLFVAATLVAHWATRLATGRRAAQDAVDARMFRRRKRGRNTRGRK